MKIYKKLFILVFVLTLSLPLTVWSGETGVPVLDGKGSVTHQGPNGVSEPGSMEGTLFAGIFAKKEVSEVKGDKGFAKYEGLATRTRTEAIALGRRILVDIGKMEAELSRLSRAPAARAPSTRKGLPAVQGAAPMANMKGPSESLLRQAGNLTRLYQKEGLQEGKERHSGPMETEARKLNQLANKYPEAVKNKTGQRILKEMSAVLARLKSQAKTHQGWIQGLTAAPAGAAPLSKPVPANIKVAPGAEGVMHDKWSPGAGGVMIDKSSPDFDGVDGESLPAVQGQPGGQIYPKVEVRGGEAGYEGVDGESLPAVQGQPGGQVYPKVVVPGGETGYEGVDGESLGQ